MVIIIHTDGYYYSLNSTHYEGSTTRLVWVERGSNYGQNSYLSVGTGDPNGSNHSYPTIPVELPRIYNNLTGKADCVFNRLNQLSDGFKSAIQKFDGEFPVSHLKFENSSTLPSNVNAQTSPP